jgi:hypothetical protein
MSKPLIYLSTLVVAGVLAVSGVLFLNHNQNAGVLHFGHDRKASTIFYPTKDQPELSIIRHYATEGGAVDDVLMRDGTTKRVILDTNMSVRQVFAYYKAKEGEAHGPLMYEKTHNLQGHLATERHLRTDGSLEMDGHFNPDNTYVRRLYFLPSAPVSSASSASAAALASPATAGTSQNPVALTVSAEQIFDKVWRHTVETDFRPDGTRKLIHTWGQGSDELVTTLAEDGKTVLSAEGTKNGSYYAVVYYPDYQNIHVDISNSYAGTTFQWYRLDQAHTLTLRVTCDNKDNDQIVIFDPSGKALISQVWSLDWSGKPYPGPDPRELDHIDHFNAAGKVDIKYDFDRVTRTVNKVTYYQGDLSGDAVLAPYGARVVYTVGPDGFATNVETFNANNTSDGGKTLTQADGKRFVLESWMVSRPSYELPKLKEGLKLYGTPPDESFDF